MKTNFLIFATLLLFSCNKKKFFDGPDSYTDNFESYLSADSLIDGANQKWSFFQITYAENSVSIDTTIFHSGGKSLRSVAGKTIDGDGVSKASINKHKMAFWEKDIVVIDAWYYIEGNDNAQWLFLIDLEEQSAIGAGPGMRLALVDNALRVEYKYNNPDVVQASGQEKQFPRNQWVNLRLEIKLSQKKKGYVKVWQDGILILDKDKEITLPDDILYFQQGTKGMYSSIEFGVTANTVDNSMTVFVDDISVSKIN